jgi:hypothetical protein
MVVTPTAERSDGWLAAVGLLTSVIVDNQLVDLDPAVPGQERPAAVPGQEPEARSARR